MLLWLGMEGLRKGEIDSYVEEIRTRILFQLLCHQGGKLLYCSVDMSELGCFVAKERGPAGKDPADS